MDFRVEWTDDFTRMTRYAYATGRFLEEWLEIITKLTGTNFSSGGGGLRKDALL